MKLQLWGLLCLFLMLCPSVLSGQGGQSELCFLWYNVENLYHPGNDTLPLDDEFTPEGPRHWTLAKYHKKLTALAKVILASGRWEPPELVGLCEVEGASVLDDLVSHPILKPYHYAYLHQDSPDHRALDLACLYRPEKVGILGWSALPSRVLSGETRDMVHVCLAFAKKDTLDLFLVHLVSKYRGAGLSAESRRKQVAHLVHCMDSVQALHSSKMILAAGDFNDGPESYSLEPLRLFRLGRDSLRWVPPEQSYSLEGTYKYRGRWSHLDQIHWCGSEGRYNVSSSVLVIPPLISRDEDFGGIKPRRTYQGYTYAGGLSDHLPVVLHLRRSLRSQSLFQAPAER